MTAAMRPARAFRACPGIVGQHAHADALEERVSRARIVGRNAIPNRVEIGSGLSKLANLISHAPWLPDVGGRAA
jgi:hypothetical protein